MDVGKQTIIAVMVSAEMAKYIDEDNFIELLRCRYNSLTELMNTAADREEYQSVYQYRVTRHDVADTIEAIEDFPEADVAPRQQGQWIKIAGEWLWRCNRCGEITVESIKHKPRARYCPNCGASMQKVKKNE